MTTDRRSFLRSALVGTALLVPSVRAVRAADIRVTTAADLNGVLAAATGGETIRLAPGEYGVLTLRGDASRGYASPVTLTSADPAAPAVFTGVRVSSVANLVMAGLRFDYRFSPEDPLWWHPFQFGGCRDLVIRGSVFDGDLARGISADEDGFGWAIGLSVRESNGVVVAGNRIQGFHRGLTIGGCRNVVVTGNELTDLRMDGMNFANMRHLRIEGNYVHGFRRAIRTKDHCDMIQFWTEGTKEQTSDILIRGNLLQAGDGDPTQSIFMRNELVDTGRAGPEMFYQNITIEDNVILNGHLHGITLGEAKGVLIQRNTLLRDPAFADRPDKAHQVYIPRINMKPTSLDVVVSNNIAAAIPKAETGWKVQGNMIVQDLYRMEPGFYELLFVPRPADAAPSRGLAGRSTLVVRPGSAADRPGLGSSLMR